MSVVTNGDGQKIVPEVLSSPSNLQRNRTLRSQPSLFISPRGGGDDTQQEDQQGEDGAPATGPSLLERKWTSVRAQALSYLNTRKQQYDRLSEQKKERLREVTLHCVFLILFSWVALSARNTAEAHYLVKGLRDEISAPIASICSESKDYTGVNNMDDFWQWLQEVCIPTLYPADPTANLSTTLYLGVNYFVSPIYVRQVRVSGHICNDTLVPANMRSKISTCFFPFSTDNEEMSPNPDVFDPISQTYGKWPNTFDWKYVNHTGSALVDSKFDLSYGNGGYVWKLADTANEAQRQLQIAHSANFLTQSQTRAIFVEYTVYNPGTNLYVTCVLFFEVPPSAGIQPSNSFRAVNLYRTGRQSSLVGLILEIVVFLFVLLFLAMETLQIYKFRLAYFKDGYNLITLVNLLIFIIVIIMEVVTIFQADGALKLDDDSFQKYDMKKLVYWTYEVYNWNAFNALLTWIKTLKYVDIVSKKSTQLALTLSKAASSIAVLMVLFIILYCGYGIAFYMAFGQDVDDFRSLGVSLVSLFRAMLGDFDFATLREANKVLGPILFISFIILVIFCLLNMFMAVIMGSYDDVVEELSKAPDELSSSIRKSVRRLLNRLLRSKKAMIEKAIAAGDDRVLTEQELQEIFEFEHDQFLRMGIKNPRYLINIADTNLDGFVTLSEIQKIQAASNEDDQEEEEELTPSQQLKILQEEQQSQRVLITQLLHKMQNIARGGGGGNSGGVTAKNDSAIEDPVILK